MKRLKKVSVVSISIALLIIYFICLDVRNFVVFAPHGSTYSGNKFGVHIGQDEPTSDRALKILPGVHHYFSKNGGLCLSKKYPSEYTVKAYIDESWRHGTICLVFQENKVKEIAWDYGFVAVTP